MNINTLKLGFANYLENISEISNKTYENLDSDISIFMYSTEFKNYISDELDVDPKILSMSINDILKMDIVNGKLVDPDEEAALQDESSIEDAEETQEKETTEEITEEEPANPEEPEGITDPEASITDTEMINPDIPLTENGETQVLNAEEFSITDMLNEFFEADAFKSVIDTDESGDLNEEEITTFLSTISGLDGDEENISLEDILNAAEAINEGEFSLAAEEEIPEEPETMEEESISAEPASSVSGSSGTNTAGNTGSTGIAGTGGTSFNSQGVEEKTLDNMTKEELNSELSTAQSDLSDKQSALSAILDGSDPQIQQLQQNIDDAYDIYQKELEKVDEDMAAQVDELKQSIDAKEAEIDAKEQEISDQEGVVADSETAYNNAVSTRESLEASLSTLKSINTSDMEESEKASLASRISALETQIAEAKQAEEEAEQTRDEAQEKLDTLEEEKEELISGEGGLNELNEQMTELEAQIADKYPAIQEYMDAYNNAKEEYTTVKESAITSAKTGITEAQNYVNEVQSAINNYDNRETARDYCFDGLTEITRTAIELAFSQLGIYEDAGDNRGTMEKYGAGAGVPWCAAFVSWLFGKGQDSNSNNPLDFTASVSNLRSQAQEAGYYSEVGSYTPVPGDIMIQKSKGASHTGIVVAVYGNTIYTIEGNSGDAVRLREYEIGGSSYQKISGWIRMNEWTGGSGDIPTDTYLSYANGSENADEINRSTR